MYENQGALRWAAKVPPHRIRILYEQEAAGLLSEDLVNEVGHLVYERCRDILIATTAARGQATCPRCAAPLPHDRRAMTMLECACGFRMRWRAYARSFRDSELDGGNAMPFFHEFVQALPEAPTVREKMLLIDRVVHAAHVAARDEKRPFRRPALSNLIEGTAEEVLLLLDRLAYGPGADPELLATRDSWRMLDRRTRPARVRRAAASTRGKAR